MTLLERIKQKKLENSEKYIKDAFDLLCDWYNSDNLRAKSEINRITGLLVEENKEREKLLKIN